MTTPTPNLDLANRTLKFIQTHPELHEQRSWVSGEFIPADQPVTEADLIAEPEIVAPCGTAACFAGWAAILGGWHQLRGDFYDLVVDETGQLASMSEAACRSLGVTDLQADALFSSSNTVESLAVMVDALTADPAVDLWPIKAECDGYEDDDD